MRKLPFKQVDVFTDRSFAGNPVAVVFDADGLSDQQMQRVAKWTNLSETTFFQTSTKGDYRLRIFSPKSELPFAGHPTIGSAHAALEAGLVAAGQTSFVQECAAGQVPITAEPDGAIMARVPTAKINGSTLDSGQVRAALGESAVGPVLLIDVGPKWIVTRVASERQLYRMNPNRAMLSNLSRRVGASGASVYTIDDSKTVQVRSFAPAEGVVEDPVCGSGNAAVAAHIREVGLTEQVGAEYTARQGAALGRDGRVRIRIEGEDIYLGGLSRTVVDGVLYV